MDVWVASVAVFGLLGGAIAVWWLLRKKKTFVVERDWHFWVKQVRSLQNTEIGLERELGHKILGLRVQIELC